MTTHDPDPLRILITGDTFAPDVNGAAKFATRLAAGLVRRGHEVHVVASALGRGRQGTRVEEHEGARFTVHRLRSILYPGHEWLRFAEPWRVRRNAASLLDALKPDVVHSQSHIIMGRAFAAEAPARGVRLVSTNHIMFENLMDHSKLPRSAHDIIVRTAWKDAASVLRRSDVVTTPTRRSADFLERHTGITGVHAISCGLNASDYIVSPTRNHGSIVFLGRVTSEKNIDVLIDAVAKLPADVDARLTVIGGGDLVSTLRLQAEQLGISDRVLFTDYVTDEQLRQHLTDGAVFAMPSTAELQSIATMEAMASGLPVVAADAMALPHLVHDGDNGYLFSPGDAADLAAKLERVLRASDEEYQRLRDQSLHLVMDHDIERTLDAFERIYRGDR